MGNRLFFFPLVSLRFNTILMLLFPNIRVGIFSFPKLQPLNDLWSYFQLDLFPSSLSCLFAFSFVSLTSVRFRSVPFILLPHSVSPQAQFLVLSRTARIHTDLQTTTHSCYYTYSYCITISLDESCTNNILRSKEWHETDIFQEARIYIFKYLRGLK